MSRIAETFAQLQRNNRRALIPFMMAYDPDYATSAQLLQRLPEAGADIIELGMPFSDPMADGPTIQASGLRALDAGATIRKILTMVSEFRRRNHNTPIVLMGYYNPIVHYGEEAFVKDAQEAGVDGLLIVDLPIEEDESLHMHCVQYGVDLIKLITPTTDLQRLQKIQEKAMGFLYYVAVAGVTGTKSATAEDVGRAVSTIKSSTTLPIAVGFGINSPEAAATMATHADAVVVGSALIQTLVNAQVPQQIDEVIEFVRSLSEALSQS